MIAGASAPMTSPVDLAVARHVQGVVQCLLDQVLRHQRIPELGRQRRGKAALPRPQAPRDVRNPVHAARPGTSERLLTLDRIGRPARCHAREYRTIRMSALRQYSGRTEPCSLDSACTFCGLRVYPGCTCRQLAPVPGRACRPRCGHEHDSRAALPVHRRQPGPATATALSRRGS